MSLGTWYTRPIFISSTFKDMHAERDWLQRRVFPRIEEELRKRRHHLEPIDLRLGVETARADSEEAREHLVLKVCLDEIKRSRPFLLVLLGDRYGWVPPTERSEAAAREQRFETELIGKSVTALEIEFGIIKNDPEQQHRSLFFFRRPLPYDRMPDAIAADYCDACSPDPLVRAGHPRLIALKKRLRDDAELGARVFDYTAAWDADAGRVTGLEEFGEMVFQHLWAALEEETRAYIDQPAVTWEEEERAALAEFCEHRGRSVVGREALVRELAAFARASEGGSQWATCLTAPAGAGKSAVFAALYHALASDNTLVVLANSAGGTQRGSQIESMLLRWVGELAELLQITSPLPEKFTSEDLDAAFLSLLQRASATHRVVVLLDALDQFEASNRGRHLTWLPFTRWPANARLIAAAQPGPASEALCRQDGVDALPLPPLTETDAAEIGRRVWQRYHRELSPAVLSILAGKCLPDGRPAAGNPLWLTLALEQLNQLDADDFTRAERDYTGSPAARMQQLLLDTAHRMPPDIAGLYGWLLVQNEKVFGAGAARAFAAAVAMSHSGWRDHDLLALIPMLAPLLAPGTPVPALDDLGLAALRRGFRAHLMRRGQSGRLDYAHAQMRRAVEHAYFTEEAGRPALHRRINDYLQGLSSDDEMIRLERMRHLIGDGNALRAASYYATLEVAEHKHFEERLGSSWTLARWIAGGERPAAGANPHLAWVVSWLTQEGLADGAIYRLANNFQWGLLDKLKYEVCLSPRRILLEHTRRALARLTAADPSKALWQRDLSVSLYKIGDVLADQGDLSGAMKSFGASLEIAERLAAADPSDAAWQRSDIVRGFNKIGDVQLA